MKTRAREVTTQAIAVALTAALAPVPAKSIGYQDVSLGIHSTPPSTTMQELPKNTFVFIPIDDATAHVKAMTERMISHRRNTEAEWEAKGEPFYLDKQSKAVRNSFHYLSDRVKESKELIVAVRDALNSLDEKETDKRRKITEFGRAIAAYRYAVEGILSFLESTHPPSEFANDISLSNEEVQALIIAEHKALGLTPPTFASKA